MMTGKGLKAWRTLQAGKLLNDIVNKKPVTEIAKEEGVTPRAILYRMEAPEFQTLLSNFASGLVTTAKARIDELWASSDPLDKRTAAQLTVAMAKMFIPRVSHTTSENLNVNLEEKHIQMQQGWDRLSPEKREALKEALIELDRQ